MLNSNPAIEAHRALRRGVYAPYMLRVDGRNRSSGAVESVGFWQGADHEEIDAPDMFSGVMRRSTFYSHVDLNVGPIRYAVGLNVNSVDVSLSSITDATLAAFREYDPRGARAQIWVREYSTETMLPLGVVPVFKGYVNGAPITRPEPGGAATISVELVSTAMSLTIPSAVKKSHEAQQRRQGDMINRYKATAGSWDVPWGQP